MKLLPVEAPATSYTCPMHPEVVSDEPGHCPVRDEAAPAQLVTDVGGGGDQEGEADEHGDHARPPARGQGDEAAAGIEWEDDMVEVNRMTTPANMRWKLVDRESGAENAGVDWRFRVGDQIKIRLLDEMAGDHPMHHPFHVHGAGRFLVLSRDGVPERNLVWGHRADADRRDRGHPADVTNPGLWMATATSPSITRAA